MKPYLLRLFIACWFMGMVALVVWGLPVHSEDLEEKYLPLLLRNTALLHNPDLKNYVGIFTRSDGHDDEIYVIRPTVTEAIQLTNNEFYKYSVVWSPDNRHISFVQYTSSAQQLLLMEIDGSNQRALWQSDTASILSYEWSPNSQWIGALIQQRATEIVDLWRLDPDTGYAYIIANDVDPHVVEPLEWSRDSYFIYYVRSNLDGIRELWVTTQDGSSHNLLTNNFGEAVKWSPYKVQLAFEDKTMSDTGLNTISLPNGTQRRALPANIVMWFTDGDHLLINRPEANPAGIYRYSITSETYQFLSNPVDVILNADPLSHGFLYQMNASGHLYLQPFNGTAPVTIEAVDCNARSYTYCKIFGIAWASDYKGFVFSEARPGFYVNTFEYANFFLELADSTLAPQFLNDEYTNRILRYLPFSSTWGVVQGNTINYYPPPGGPTHDRLRLFNASTAETIRIGRAYTVDWRYLP